MRKLYDLPGSLNLFPVDSFRDETRKEMNSFSG